MRYVSWNFQMDAHNKTEYLRSLERNTRFSFIWILSSLCLVKFSVFFFSFFLAWTPLVPHYCIIISTRLPFVIVFVHSGDIMGWVLWTNNENLYNLCGARGHPKGRGNFHSWHFWGYWTQREKKFLWKFSIDFVITVFIFSISRLSRERFSKWVIAEKGKKISGE